MEIIRLIYLLTGTAVVATLILFAVTSFRERHYRAFCASLAISILAAIIWISAYLIGKPYPVITVALESVIVIVLLLYFLPLKKPAVLRIENIAGGVDERNVIFAREEYSPGTEKYDIYYGLHPDKKQIDDRIRQLPELLQPGGRFYDPVYSRYIDANFTILKKLCGEVEGEISPDKVDTDPRSMTEAIRDFALDRGAADVGFAELNRAFLYTNVGRGPQKWGSPIVNNHKFVIMFTLEMRYDFVAKAPHLPITDESASQYINAAAVSLSLAAFIRSLGYSARAHIAGSNYQIIMPAAAHDAGLGELGRIGYLISPRLGPRIRLGGVTTDLPILPGRPIVFGVQDFCEKCLKCAENCPSGAIPAGRKINVRGVEKWQLDIERCLHYWRILGTDCGLCMKVCPYSHPPTFFHNIVRAGIKKSPVARYLSVHADDLIYGRKAPYFKTNRQV